MDFITVDLVIQVLEIILVFGMGLIIKSPLYKKGKRLVGLVSKALEDDNLSAAEMKEIYEAAKSKVEDE